MTFRTIKPRINSSFIRERDNMTFYLPKSSVNFKTVSNLFGTSIAAKFSMNSACFFPNSHSVLTSPNSFHFHINIK